MCEIGALKNPEPRINIGEVISRLTLHQQWYLWSKHELYNCDNNT